MGAVAYWYVVKYRPNVGAVLQELREREFRAGRYNPAMPFPDTRSPGPGARHRTIQEALRASGADGTRSILDIDCISETPECGAAAPLSDELLMELYGTTQPTQEDLDQGDVFEHIDRGQCVFIFVYRDDQPDEIAFAGYSYD
jgi:hypothetical protein